MSGISSSRYLWVVGHGGSGTKRVCHLLDLSPVTHCRYVNQAVAGSPQAHLPDPWIPGAGHEKAMGNHWSRVVEWSRQSWCDSDRVPPPPKSFIGPFRQLAWRMVSSRRIRAAITAILQAESTSEHRVGKLLANQAGLSRAILVMKTNQVPAWTAWVLNHCPQAHIIHVVRHPGGVLRAWRRRFAETSAGAASMGLSRDRMQRIAAHWSCDEARKRVSVATAAEEELWAWRYETELIHQSGHKSRNYFLAKDEDVWSDPETFARRLFEFAGLTAPAVLAQWTAQMATPWTQNTLPWWADLREEDREVVRRVMTGSPLAGWWTADQKVSGSEYRAY